MRALQISKFYPPILGGIETVAWELAEGLAKLGVTSDILCSHHASRSAHERWPAGYEVWRSGSVGRMLSTSVAPSMPWKLRRLIQSADLIHIHMPDPMAATALWAVRPSQPVVVHWHSDVVRQRRALALYEPLQNWVLSRSDAIIATSRPYAESSLPLQPWLDKVHVIPIGISDNHGPASEAVADAVRRRFAGRRIVFALGRMTYYKGFNVLIEAAKALPADCAVIIGGSGDLLDSYRDHVRDAGLQSRVFLVGQIPDHELAGYFEACDVFCMPSIVRAEAYGIAVVEAMSMGKPVVASDIPGSGVPWVNQHGVTGLNVSAGDPSALAEALIRLLDDPVSRHTLGQAARARYLNEFRAPLMSERTLALYRQLAPRPAHVRAAVPN